MKNSRINNHFIEINFMNLQELCDQSIKTKNRANKRNLNSLKRIHHIFKSIFCIW